MTGEYMQTRRKRNTFISSGILISLSLITLALVMYIGYIMFANKLLPVSFRIVIVGLLGVLSLLLLLMGLSDLNNIQKMLGVFLNTILLLVVMLAILYINTGMSTLYSIQHDSLAASGDEEVAEAIDVEVDHEGFIVYIAGHDNYGNLEDEGRTDVNILVAVNPQTRQIVMVSVPRDSYLRIPGKGANQYDKLTHAGNYGIRTSIRTLENALDIDVNYFVQMNFSSFMEIIDAVDGVEVDNPDAFLSSQSNNYYDSGIITLDSAGALDFVRERYNLPEGDFSRQRNQGLVIEAVFKKVVSTDLLFNFQGVMEAVSDSVATNMPVGTIMDFVNYQMSTNADWDFQTLRVSGEDAMGLPSYAMPDYELYMFVPDEDNMDHIHEVLTGILDGTYLISENEENDIESHLNESSEDEEPDDNDEQTDLYNEDEPVYDEYDEEPVYDDGY